jgi:glycosyltransferase involved in cell wall biosynthesis
LKIAWISFFPIEWLPGLPEPLQNLPKQHPATWQRVLLEEFKQVPGLKLDVLVVRRHFARSFSFDLDGVTFHCLKLPRGMRTLSLFWWETVLIRRRLRALNPDLIHAWGTERGAALVASRLPYPYLVTMQGLLGWYLEHVDLGPFVRLEAWLERVSLRRAAVATVESGFGMGWLGQHHPRLKVLQAEHAPHVLFHQVRRIPQVKPVQFLYVGTMSLIKGIDLLLKALDRLLPGLDFRLTIVGSGGDGLLQKLRTETSAALWDRITLRQHLQTAQIVEEMQRTTIALFPSRVDNSPNSVKEAVVAGVPVVASATGGIVDYVISGRNGLTFGPGNLEEFISAVKAAVEHPLFGQGKVDPQTLSQTRVYLSPQVMRERFLEAYQAVLETARVKEKQRA